MAPKTTWLWEISGQHAKLSPQNVEVPLDPPDIILKSTVGTINCMTFFLLGTEVRWRPGQ